MSDRKENILACIFHGIDIFHRRAKGLSIDKSEVFALITNNKFSRHLKTDSFLDNSREVVSNAWNFATGIPVLENDFDSTSSLSSIFNRLNDGKYELSFGLRELGIDSNDFFPNKNVCNTKERYSKLWDSFIGEFNELSNGTFRAFVESSLYLLKKYCWAMPISKTAREISLYDAVRLSVAFADCLSVEHSETTPFLFVGGDLSGIQKFIYHITSKQAAVSLKGRSFYLQLLVDSAIHRILTHKNINSTIAQVVYSSGGKFYMLLPNSESVKDAISELKKEFQKYLWDELNGELLLNIAYIPFANSSEVGSLWKQLADKLTEEKNKKFSSVIDYSLFEPKDASNLEVCDVTGIESEQLVKVDDDCFVLPIVNSQINLGRVLKDADFIITHNGSEDFKANGYKCDIEIFGIHNYLFDESELYKRDAEFREIKSKESICVKRINSFDFLLLIKGWTVSYGFQFYGGNKQAVDGKGNNKTFEQLAKGQYFGVLRMDVDNLGSIFIKGLPDDLRSFAGYSTLSFMLDYFFSGYLNTIRKKYKDDVNILYSGGDDVFAVGRWDKLILFAEDIRKEFAKYVGRDDISISGGVVMVDGKFPIAKAAEMAGEEEEKAKKANESKNSFSLFGEVVSWKDEFEKVKKQKEKFVDLCKNENMPRSILHRIMTLYAAAKSGDNSWLWHWVYYVARFVDGKSESVVEYCQQLKKDLCCKENLRKASIAARWAELELRFSDNDK